MSFVCLQSSECYSISCPWRPHPIQALTGQVPDISHFLHFSFWEPVYYKVDENEPDHRFLPIQMRNEDVGLVLLTTRVIILQGRYLLMKQNKS